MPIKTSIIIRTYNEERYLGELLRTLNEQVLEDVSLEVILVDSGSTDKTLEIAKRHNCRIIKITKTDFTFGYSLNIGCQEATGEILVFISGHCIPATRNWLKNLIAPLYNGSVDYCYGRQIGRDTTKFSENIHFEKTFPDYDKLPQIGYFCNNANAGIIRGCWEQYRFDETLTGLEDMHLSKRLVENGGKVGYSSTAAVYHIHNETWAQVMNRYEREAYALQRIVPELHFTRSDFIRFYCSSLLADMSKALEYKRFLSVFLSILKFRLYMYLGTYRGNRDQRQLSEKMKMTYFYPKDQERRRYDNR